MTAEALPRRRGASPRRFGVPAYAPRHAAPVTARRVLAALLRPLSTVVMLLSLAFLLALAIGPHTGAYRTVTMLTGSMRPRYPVGAVLIDTPEPLSRLRVGQVLTYQAPIPGHAVFSHRVIAIDRAADGSANVQTKGDANNGPDPWRAHIQPGQVWTVRGVVPHLGSVLAQLRRPSTRVALQYLLPAGLLCWLLMAIWAPTRRAGQGGYARA